MKQETQTLAMKKATFSAWAKILYREGMIDLQKYSQMITRIERLKEPAGAHLPAQAPDEAPGLQMTG